MDNIFFILSKLAWSLLSPSNLLVLLMCLAAILLLINRIRLAKWILLPTAMLSLAILSYPLGDMLINPLESRFSKPEKLPNNIDGIIILGGGEELKLSVDWQTAEVGNGGDRFIAAAILAKQYPNVPIIFSGGSGLLHFKTTTTGGDIARTLLTAVGINKDRLIIESLARNTYENFVFLQPLLPKRKGTYLLVTSAFHMPRAVGIARKLHLNIIPYPVDYRGNTEKFRQWDFNLFEHLQSLEPSWREWIGLTVYYWTGKTNTWLPSPSA